MKRLDLLWGVSFLTFTMLLPLFLQIFGYLDEKTYQTISHHNTFYGESMEPILDFSSYRTYLVYIYLQLFIVLIGVSFEHTMRRLSRFQIQCYRPYYLYHCAVCLIPLVIKYANMTANTSDVIMVHVNWKQFFYVKTSILRFVLSFVVSLVPKYKFSRLVSYVFITIIHAFMLTYILSSLYIDCLERVENFKRSKAEFLTTWFHSEHEQINTQNVSKENYYRTTFLLNESLFLKTGQIQYRTMDIKKSHVFDANGEEFPYYRQVFTVGNGESVQLSCNTISKTKHPLNVLWFLNESYLDPNVYFFDEEKQIINDDPGNLLKSTLNIDFVENSGYGDYTCFLRNYSYGEKITFASKKAATFIHTSNVLIGQYSVRQYTGRDFYVYATPGGALDLTWKSMNFDNEKEDVIQYYLINGKHFEKQRISTSCSSISYLYIVYGRAMKWFSLPFFRSSSDNLINFGNLYKTHFTKCAGRNVFGVHTVEYFRRVYDKKSKAFVLREVKHPDTLYVLPDVPYFSKMDNATKAKKKLMIKHLQDMKLDYTWFENSDTLFFYLRVIAEPIVVIFTFFIIMYLLSKILGMYKRFVIWPLNRFILGQPHYTDQWYVRKNIFSYSCYIFCGNADKESVYTNLVCPLRRQNISTGFSFEECALNKCGRSIFDIQCDLMRQSDHLIFYITSSYIEEISFNDIYLETVLDCIRRGIVSANRVLFIIADNCELPDKLRYLFPEASSNIHDWVVSTNIETRCRRVLDWIKKEKESKTPERVVSTIFVGQSLFR